MIASKGSNPRENRRSVLVLEDNTSLAQDLSDYLSEDGWEVTVAFTVEQARASLVNQPFDLVLADYFLPDSDVMSVLNEIAERAPQAKILVMTGDRAPDLPIQAFRNGAADFLHKPFTLEKLEQQLARILSDEKSGPANTEASENRDFQVDRMVGESPVFRRVVELVGKVADTDLTVLITGESGTGKELLAQALHQWSSRNAFPFVPVNCAAIPEPLLEDELFGHVPGAYTGAKKPRAGKFEEAQQGTLFLDEIGEMACSLQAKLLRVLEDRQVQRLGSFETVDVDTRIVAATNAKMEEKLEKGEFRRDLFHRLNMINIHVPPLKERTEDIPLLVNTFLSRASKVFRLPEKGITPEALRRFLDYDWPGNVRELRNVVEAAVLLSGEREALGPEDFALLNQQRELASAEECVFDLPCDGLDLSLALAEFEADLIRQSLQRTNGNKRKAAELLSLKRTTLVAKVRRYGISEDEAARDWR